MINQIQISNFKCFQDPKTFSFSNLNLLTGINGRGKSTVLQAILLIAQSSDKYHKLDKLILNGKYVCLGNYEDIKNSETPRSQNIFFNIRAGNIISSELSFNENINDEMTAVLHHNKFEIDDIEDLKEIRNSVAEVTQIAEIKLDNKINVDINSILFNQFTSKIHYISADRIGPVKYVDKASFNENDFITVGSRGEFSINILAKQNHDLVNEKLYLGNDSRSVLQQTEEWLNYILEGAKLKIEGLDKNSSVLWMLLNNKSNKYKYKPMNIGFGYSYILPLIISGLIAKRGEIIIVENPEAHLHPRAQARIAEFFARVASCGIQVFVESHSEHILNGFRLGVLNKSIDLNHDQLLIHYFNENFNSERLLVDAKGKIENWPSGFFDQQEIDLADIYKFNK